jgi:hypothetical protein
MIVTRIFGGLGNQMFQYAAGTALSHRLGVEHKLDVSDYLSDGHRRFELDAFHTRFRVASAEECAPYRERTLLKRVSQRLRPPYRRDVYKQPGFGYDSRFTEAGDGRYLNGYWQSWRFFEKVEPLIREHFTLRREKTERVSQLAEQLRRSETVSVHVRRGDYKTREAQAYHGILPASYYREAIERVLSRHPKARFLFFSDDMEWVRAHLDTRLPLFDSGDEVGRTALEDLHLMQHCRHHVIANSSFSWWGAWLNPDPDKTVVAPVDWFATKENETKDIVPPSWIRV